MCEDLESIYNPCAKGLVSSLVGDGRAYTTEDHLGSEFWNNILISSFHVSEATRGRVFSTRSQHASYKMLQHVPTMGITVYKVKS